MPYNLIEEPWIPVRRENGDEEWICPWEVTDHLNGASPIQALNAARPDFNGSLIQFLIGLVQTVIGPQDQRAWRKRLQQPPSPEELRDSFSEYESAFELGGEPPRFMQDYGGVPDPTSAHEPISHLLLNTPTGKTLDDNKDHFVKRKEGDSYCPACTAAALYTHQAHTPGKGAGNKESLRGGGPVVTVILGRNLWHTIWVNILPSTLIDQDELHDNHGPSDTFPWLAPTRTSEDGTITTPENGHSLQVFWGMPRRIYLGRPDDTGGPCSICGRQANLLYQSYRKAPHGIEYAGSWNHPLTPYRRNSEGGMEAKLMRREGTSYPHWLGFGVEGEGEQPAKVVKRFYDRATYSELDPIFEGNPQLWVFGFETDRISKIQAWREGRMPLFQVDKQLLPHFERFSAQIVEAADLVVHKMKVSILKGLYYKPVKNTSARSKKRIKWKGESKYPRRDNRLSNTLFDNNEDQFWKDTEPSFYRTLSEGLESMRREKSLDPIKKNWVQTLRTSALDLFDETTQYGHFHAADPKAVAIARQELTRFSSPRTSTIRKALDLPKPDAETAA